MKLLVVSASSLELAGIETGETRVVGVGKLQAALHTAQAIGEVRPVLVVCIGTARALDPSLKVGDLVCASSVWQHEVDLCRFGLKEGELPNENGGVLGELSCLPVGSLACGRCASGDVFVTRPYQEAHPQLSGSLFCDMESYGVAYAASQAKCKVSVIRVISDDSYGHRAKHYATLVREANKRIERILSHISQREVPDDLHDIPVVDD